MGLDPADWNGIGYDGLIYGAGGNRISITPATGTQLTVMGIDGVVRVLKPSYLWNLWYDMATAQWYYHNITPSEKIDITTLQKQTL